MPISHVETFLSQLDDNELAYFRKYKLQSYLPETQKEIVDFLKGRGITESDIEKLIANNPKSKLTEDRQRCPKCYTDKIRKEEIQWIDTANKGDYFDEIASLDGISRKATYKTKIGCNVCGYGIMKPNSYKRKSLLKKVGLYIQEVIHGIISGI